MNWITPMEPVSCPEVNTRPGFIHEIKWDGIRGMVYLERGSVRMFTKKGNERTDFYPELTALAKVLAEQETVLDGEIIVLDDRGQPNFHKVLVRETVKNKKNLQYYIANYPACYVVFDILKYRGRSLLQTELLERKRILKEAVGMLLGQNKSIFLSEVYEDGSKLYELMKQKDMEGIVSKKVNSIYLPGKKHEEWFKTKFTKKMLCVIGGIQWKESIPNSLLMGIRSGDNTSLTFMGKASLGLKGADLQLLKQYREHLVQKACPFDKESIAAADIAQGQYTWTTPALTCWVSFLELSDDGHFRHPKILGFTNIPAGNADGKVLTD